MGSKRSPVGWQLAVVAGIPIVLARGWLLIAGWLTFSYALLLDRLFPDLGSAHYLVALVFPVAFGVSVLLHELGHAAAGAACGLRAVGIVVDGLGGETEFAQDAAKPGRAFVVALAGPLASAAVATLAMFGAATVAPGGVAHLVLTQIALGNAILVLFNLLPGLPLDGGHLLQALVWRVSGNRQAATTVAAFVGLLLAVALIVVPIGLIVNAGSRPNPLFVVLLVVIAGPLGAGAWSILRESQIEQSPLPGSSAYRLAHPAVVIHPATSVQEAIRVLTARGATVLVLLDAAGRPYALAGEHALAAVRDNDRGLVAVGQVAVALTAQQVLPPGLAGCELLARVRAVGAREYLLDLPGDPYPAVLLARDVEAAAGDAATPPKVDPRPPMTAASY